MKSFEYKGKTEIIILNLKPGELIKESIEQTKLKRIVDFTKKSILVDDANPVRLPGERIETFIKDHKANGIPIEESIWNKIQSL